MIKIVEKDKVEPKHISECKLGEFYKVISTSQILPNPDDIIFITVKGKDKIDYYDLTGKAHGGEGSPNNSFYKTLMVIPLDVEISVKEGKW